jgi:hypothetical protein
MRDPPTRACVAKNSSITAATKIIAKAAVSALTQAILAALTQAILATKLSTVQFSSWKQLKTYIKIINGRAQPHPPHRAHDTIKLDHIAPPSTNKQLSPIFFTNATSPYPAPSYFAIR